MKICISGWYFHEPFLRHIASNPYYKATVVGHRTKPTFGIPLVLTNGYGLDFGCYQKYLMELWDGESDVLFIQDDGEIRGPALENINAIAEKQDIDHAYIFRDEYEEFANSGLSSRAMWFRASFLWQVRQLGGFDVDAENECDTTGRRANWALGMFARRIENNPRCGWVAIVPDLHMGRRGWIPTESYQYKRAKGDIGLVTPASVL